MRRQKLKASVCFLFAYWDVSDCFYDGLMPQTVLELLDFQLLKNILWDCYGILSIVKVITSYSLANKKLHSCWLILVLWVVKMALFIGKLTTH